MAWYNEAKFGCFIHWGVYSVPAGIWKGKELGGYTEHLMRKGRIPLEQYKKELVVPFNPTEFDAEEWVRHAVEAGMKYFIITAKHHDGFAMYLSDAYPYDMRMTRYGKDPMEALRKAARKYGIKFGFYYSHAFDWEHPDAPGNDWDFTRFNPAHFQHIEKCIQALMTLGIEADLIVMHPYDRWGFSMMKAEDDDRYWKYVLARFSAYRNVWWSLANEYDLMHEKTLSDWERYASIICEKDPYHHLRSIHNCKAYYDYNLPWITHCSIQRTETYRSSELVNEWREKYHKPVVLDEICYEGNIQFGWGNISGEEMTRRFWEAFCRGGYPGHGETYLSPDRILWWSHGGVLHGTSPERIRFLAKIMEETPGLGVEPMPCKWDEVACRAAGFPARKDYFIYYYSFMRPGFRDFYFDDTTEYQVEIIDTWEMTITDGGVHKGKFRVKLPGKEYMAVRLRVAK